MKELAGKEFHLEVKNIMMLVMENIMTYINKQHN